MAYISFQPKDHYNTKLYTGTGSELALTGVGFQPDFTWIKRRNATSNAYLYDAVRGATKQINADGNWATNTEAQSLKSFNADGFTLGTDGGNNTSSGTYVSYNWNASGSTTIPAGNNSSPTIASCSINTTAGIGIYKYSSANTPNQIVHGLGKTPQFVMIKNLDNAQDWACYHSRVDGTLSEAGDFFLRLNTTAAPSNNSGYFNDMVTTDTVINLQGDYPVARQGNYICYAFTNIDGFSRFGKYMGNVQVNGGYVHLGFAPAFVMIKSTGTRDWFMYDNKRPMNAQGFFNPNQNFLMANATNAESNNVNLAVDFLSNGFKIRTTAGDINGDGDAILYMAFAEHPVISSNGVPATAR